MPTGKTVFGLGAFEGKTVEFGRTSPGLDIHGRVDADGNRLRFEADDAVEIARSAELDELTEFTVEARVRPTRLGERQNVLEGQTPPVALFVEPDGRVTGSVHTADGWQSVTSERKALDVDTTSLVRFSRQANGILRLELDREEVGRIVVSGELARVGDTGFVVGAAPDGDRFQFEGEIEGIRIIDGLVTAAGHRRRLRVAEELRERLQEAFGRAVDVEADSERIDHRFDHIKSIMHSAGVEDAAQLSRLTIDRPTTLDTGTVLVAPRKLTTPGVDWSDVAAEFATARAGELPRLLASNLVNRNSVALLRAEATVDDSVPVLDTGRPNVLGSSHPAAGRGEPRLGRGVGLPGITRGSPLERSQPLRLPEVARAPVTDLPDLNPMLLDAFDGGPPVEWLGLSAPTYTTMSLDTLPVDSAVIIAGTLDLRNTRLRIEPDVRTLYVIAERVICGPNAEITWRRPGGSTPPRAPDPAKDGRSWSGVHTDSNGNGLPGADGRDGDVGIDGAPGRHAPNVELWVKDLSDIPDVDLEGERGITGGRGQRGGRGGRGAQGEAGEWWFNPAPWDFGKDCWDDPGHGGDGGDGGDGGRGGRGGRGGGGGDVTIAVLEGTLEETVTSRSFKLDNDGGAAGRGSDGGERGPGGAGGSHGYTEVCTGGKDGADGQHGERGRTGPDGTAGSDGTITFMEFTEESWDEQLTRPWIMDTVPTAAFPGTELRIKGSRFADTDRVVLDGRTLTPTLLADGQLAVEIPEAIDGGEKTVFVRRHDGAESNREAVRIKPRLDAIPSSFTPGTTAQLDGRAFLPGASVLFDGNAIPADVSSATRLSFEVPDTGAAGATERSVDVAVRNPDGYQSNTETVRLPRVLANGFQIGVHDFAFANFAAGSPSWDTFEDTFGALEVWHELLDPVFGHPILTPAFYAFYHYFLLGEDNDGLATGFCTSLSAVALDEFWQGSSDTHSRYSLDSSTRNRFTAIHGRLLSRESLVRMHDQGRRGVARVERSFRIIEEAFEHGDRESAPMLFFIPAGAVWDEGYVDSLGDSHCIVPVRIEYPVGHDGSDVDGVTLHCWDCNHPVEDGEADARNCRVEFSRDGDEIHFEYYDGTDPDPKFTSQDGVTLGTQTLGQYVLSDVDLPFSGPFGVTRFVVEFLLSPATLRVEDAEGRVTGLDGDAIRAEIPDSHPMYLCPNAYLLPVDTAMTRRLTGTADGSYEYHSIAPGGTSLSLEGVPTTAGETDTLRVNDDGTQIQFEPGTEKTFGLTVGRDATDVTQGVRGIAVEGITGTPSASVDVTLSPDLSMLRIGNRASDTTVSVRALGMDVETTENATNDRGNVSLPTNTDLTVAVTDWEALDMTVRTVPFDG